MRFSYNIMKSVFIIKRGSGLEVFSNVSEHHFIIYDTQALNRVYMLSVSLSVSISFKSYLRYGGILRGYQIINMTHTHARGMVEF